jgi:hypothetical protein
VQATKTFAKLKPVIQAALDKVQHVIKGAIKIIAPMSYRQRYHQSTGRDPLRCPHCQGEMAVWHIWHPCGPHLLYLRAVKGMSYFIHMVA